MSKPRDSLLKRQVPFGLLASHTLVHQQVDLVVALTPIYFALGTVLIERFQPSTWLCGSRFSAAPAPMTAQTIQ